MTTITTIKERPILMCADMVLATLADRKTQTRRIVKPQFTKTWGSGVRLNDDVFSVHVDIEEADGTWKWIRCPYGKPGDRLWVRESFSPICDFDPWGDMGCDYRAGYQGDQTKIKWTPSIHMPRCASRLTLEITEIRVEQLQDISAEDAIAEGAVDPDYQWWHVDSMCRGQFQILWQSINGKDSWEQNPWVWVVGFKRVEGMS